MDVETSGQQTVEFPNGNVARLVRTPASVDIQPVITALNLPASRALLILNGGTAGLEADVRARLEQLLAAVAGVVIEEGITLLTGGTNEGIFSLLGAALANSGALRAPCIGVSVAGRAGLERLEPHHSHFVLVEGDAWGEETPVMYDLAAAISRTCPSLAIFAGGGEITINEMRYNVLQKRELILIAGSKRSTDAVIAAHAGDDAVEDRLKQIASAGRITVFGAHQPATDLAALVRSRLLPG
jgi:hypothetical protein